MDLVKLKIALGNRRDAEYVTIPAGALRALIAWCEDTEEHEDLLTKVDDREREVRDLNAAFEAMEVDVA
jgi:hypothetical protein